MSELDKLRKEIDQIDDEILSLLKKRMIKVAKVGEYKTRNRDKFFIRSARESDMIRSIVAKSADTNLPPSAIISIWRKIITSANIYEQDLKIGVWNPEGDSSLAYIIKDYYLNDISLENFRDISNLFAAANREINIIAFPHFKERELKWWKEISKQGVELKIYARLPFLVNFGQEIFIAAAKNMEQSSDDKTLLVFDFLDKEQVDIEAVIEKLGYGKTKILDTLKSGDLLSLLIELPMFIGDESNISSKLKDNNIGVKIIGCYS